MIVNNYPYTSTLATGSGPIGSAGATGSVGPVGATGPQGIQTKNHQFPMVKKIADDLQLTIEKFKEISHVDIYPNYIYIPKDYRDASDDLYDFLDGIPCVEISPTPWTLKFNFVKKDFISIINEKKNNQKSRRQIH